MNSTFSSAAAICSHQSFPPSNPTRSCQSGMFSASSRCRNCVANGSPSARADGEKDTRRNVGVRAGIPKACVHEWFDEFVSEAKSVEHVLNRNGVEDVGGRSGLADRSGKP